MNKLNRKEFLKKSLEGIVAASGIGSIPLISGCGDEYIYINYPDSEKPNDSERPNSDNLAFYEPLAYWPLDGDINDVSGNNNNGNRISNVNWSSDGVSGKCLSFENGHVQISDGVMEYGPNQDFTWMLWFNRSETAGWNQWDEEVLMSRRRYHGDDDQLGQHMLCRKNGRVQVNITADRLIEPKIYSTSYLKTGEWHHVAVVRNTTLHRFSLYIDGLFESEIRDNGADMSKPAGFRIGQEGRTYGGSRQFHGLIDEVAVFNKTLSPEDIYSIVKEYIN